MSTALIATVRVRDLAPGQILVHPSRPDTVFDPPPGSTITLSQYLVRVTCLDPSEHRTLWYREVTAPTAGPWGLLIDLDDTVEVLR